MIIIIMCTLHNSTIYFFKYTNFCVLHFVGRIIKLIICRKFFEILTMIAKDWNDCTDSNINMRETACKAKLSDHK